MNLRSISALLTCIVFGTLNVASSASISELPIYEAQVDRTGANQEGKRYSPPVKIVKLGDTEKEALREVCGGDFAKLSHIAPKPTAAVPWYPYDMRLRGESATVRCLIVVNTNGEVSRIYRLGDISDPFFVECARALVQWKFKKAEQERYYRVTLSAGISTESSR